MGIKHATLTAVADDPAYDIGSDEWNADHTADTITIATGTITVSNPAWNVTQTWNAGAVTFTGLKLNVTDMASAAGSLLADWQVGGVSKFSISKAGKTTTDAGSNETVATFTNSAGQPWYVGIGNATEFSSGWLAIGPGATVDKSTYAIKVDPVYGAVFRNSVGSPSFNSDVTGRGVVPMLSWTNAGGNFNGTCDVGQSYSYGASATANLRGWIADGTSKFQLIRWTDEQSLYEVSSSGDVSANIGINGQSIGLKSLTELLTIAAAATSTTTIQKPAHAIILGVSVRVTTAVTCTSTFTVGDSTSAARFSTAAVSKALNSTDKGTKAGAYYNATAEGIIITPDTVPADATGRVRVTIHYFEVTAPTS